MSRRGGSINSYYKFRKLHPNFRMTTATRRDGYNYDMPDETETNYKIEKVKEPPRLVRSDEYYDYMSNGVKKTKDISIDKFSFKKSRYKQLKKNIAANIKQLRSEKKLNCEDIAQKSGVTRQYIGQIEKGEKNITLEKLCDIAEALDVDVEYLLGKFPKSKAEKYIQLLVMEIQKLSSNRQTNLCIEILKKMKEKGDNET